MSSIEFEGFIRNLISRSRLDSKYIQLLTDPASLNIYRKAFTHISYNSKHNYEFFEQLGDITLNKFLVCYFHNRFPKLNNSFGVKIVARLRIKYGSKQFLSELAESLDFERYIKITESMSQGKKMSILEDVFEAFIGASEYIIDQRIFQGYGYICCYQLLQSFFDSIYIDLSYEKLFDAKTRLKELFDINKDVLGNLVYEFEKTSSGSTVVYVYRNFKSKKIMISCSESGINKAAAEQTASEQALSNLAREGFSREIPSDYKNILSSVI